MLGSDLKIEMKRDIRIEVLRTVLMFCICLLHAAQFGLGFFHPLAKALLPAVDGFVFITGYYGLHFSLRKILKLYGIGLCCAAVASLLSQAGVKGIWPIFREYWFLHAYVFMMCMAPLVNGIIERHASFRATMMIFFPFLFLVFGWGFMMELPVVHRYVPVAPGLGSFTGLTLLGVYVLARIYSVYDLESKIKTNWLLAALLPLVAFACIGNGWFAHYCSPLAVLMAACVFSLFRRMPKISGGPICFAVRILGSSLFSIYLLHSHPGGFLFVKNTMKELMQNGLLGVLSAFIVAAILFVSCGIVDGVRRFVIMLVVRVKDRMVS